MAHYQVEVYRVTNNGLDGLNGAGWSHRHRVNAFYGQAYNAIYKAAEQQAKLDTKATWEAMKQLREFIHRLKAERPAKRRGENCKHTQIKIGDMLICLLAD